MLRKTSTIAGITAFRLVLSTGLKDDKVTDETTHGKWPQMGSPFGD